MNGKRYGSAGNNGFEIYGEFGAVALQRKEWQTYALKQAEIKRALRAAGVDRSATNGMDRRTIAEFIGSAFVRFGLRLQGRQQVTATSQ